MAILGSATYKLDTDNSRLTRGMAKAERSSRESSRRIAGNFAKIGAGMLSVGGVIGFGLLKLVGQASTLEESINAVNVVFTTGSKAIHDYSRNSAKAVGLAKSDFLQLSAQTGGLFTNYGLSADEAANKTIILAERAADLASVYNTDVKRAFDAMSAGIRGETEAIRFFGGTDVTDASLEMFLLEKGIGKKVSELSQAEKGLFRFEAMLAQTDNTSGDFANTARSAANATKILKAQIKDTAAGIGQGLLPVVEAVLPLVQNAVASFTAWAEANPKLVQVLVIAVATVAALAVGIGGLLLVVAGGIMVFTALGVATLITVGWIALIVLGVAALVAVGILLVKHWDKVKSSLVSVFKTVKDWLQPVVDLFNRWAANNPKLMRALVIARQAVDGLTMALGWLRQEVEGAWEAIVTFAEEQWAKLQGIWDEHVAPIWEDLKEEWEKHIGPAFLWLDEKFKGLPGFVQLAFLGAAAILGASMLALLAVWVAKMLFHFAVFMATSLRRMAVWTAKMLIQFAVFTATSLARMALWPAQMLLHLAVWTATSLLRMALWVAAMLAQFALWTATTLLRLAGFLAARLGAGCRVYDHLAGSLGRVPGCEAVAGFRVYDHLAGGLDCPLRSTGWGSGGVPGGGAGGLGCPLRSTGWGSGGVPGGGAGGLGCPLRSAGWGSGGVPGGDAGGLGWPLRSAGWGSGGVPGGDAGSHDRVGGGNGCPVAGGHGSGWVDYNWRGRPRRCRVPADRQLGEHRCTVARALEWPQGQGRRGAERHHRENQRAYPALE